MGCGSNQFVARVMRRGLYAQNSNARLHSGLPWPQICQKTSATGSIQCTVFLIPEPRPHTRECLLALYRTLPSEFSPRVGFCSQGDGRATAVVTTYCAHTERDTLPVQQHSCLNSRCAREHAQRPRFDRHSSATSIYLPLLPGLRLLCSK